MFINPAHKANEGIVPRGLLTDHQGLEWAEMKSYKPAHVEERVDR
jgi:hypothetical protein